MQNIQAKSKESLQSRLMKPVIGKKTSDHRASLRNAGLAIVNVILDSRIPKSVVKRDLEDLREAVDFAINIIASGSKKATLH